MKETKIKKERRLRRRLRVRRRLIKLATRLRLSVFRSNKHFYAQIIDDAKGKTLVSISEKELGGDVVGNKTVKARELGRLFAQKAKKKKIETVAFDRGAYKYHGRVKSFADAVREEGLKF